MSLAERLRQEAELLANSLKKEMAGVALEKREIETETINGNEARLAWLNKALQAGVVATDRLSEYHPTSHKRLTCPYCWMLEGKTIVLMAVKGPEAAISCGNCSAEYNLDDQG